MLECAGGDCVVVIVLGFLLFFLFLLAFTGIFCELACSFWISVIDNCLSAGGGYHPFFVFFFATTTFGGGGNDLDKLELCLDLLVDFLD